MAREQHQYKQQEDESLLLNRRSYLALAGSAIAATIGGDTVHAQTATGYGKAGYGESLYRGSEPEPSVPVVDSFSLTTSEELGDDRMVTVKWEVSDSESDLDVVEVVVNDGSYNLNFAVTDVSGRSASGWDIFQFPLETTLNVNIRVTDTAGYTTKESQSIIL
jgi:hypothetical protein